MVDTLPREIIVKLFKKKILKASIRKKHMYFKETKIRLANYQKNKVVRRKLVTLDMVPKA